MSKNNMMSSSHAIRIKIIGNKESKKLDFNPKNNIKQNLQNSNINKSINPKRFNPGPKINNVEMNFQKSRDNIIKKPSSKKVNPIIPNTKKEAKPYKISVIENDKRNFNLKGSKEANNNFSFPITKSNAKIQPKTNIPPKVKNNKYVKLAGEGNISYCISTLYCLANNNNIIEYLSNLYEKKAPIDQTKNPITFLFYRMLSHFQKKDKDLYSLKNFCQQISAANFIFKGKKEKKVTDFILFLLEKFHQDDKIENKIFKEIELKQEIYSNINKFQEYLKYYEKSFIFQNYAWINEKNIKCLGCKNENKINSYYFTYDLNISSAINKFIIESSSEINRKLPNLSIKKCIEYNLEPEILYNVYCPSCDKKTNLERKNLIYPLSDNIIILLNGIEQQNIMDSMKENNIIITIDKVLELPLDKFLNGMKRRYKINSVIYYDFNNKSYINYCYHNNIWIRYSENNITERQSDEFLNSEKFPVVIFYSAN